MFTRYPYPFVNNFIGLRDETCALSPMDNSNPKDRIGDTKPSIGLIPTTALVEEAQAMKEGAAKYGTYNWRETKVRTTVYTDAALRHLLAFMDGEDIDPDSGLPHEAKVRACMAILIDARHSNTLIDDRSKSYKTANLIRSYTSKG